MVFVEVDPMVMLTSGVTSTARVLPVLSNSSVAVRNMTAQFSGLLFGCRHNYCNKIICFLSLINF
jgi:hypothetical protein